MHITLGSDDKYTTKGSDIKSTIAYALGMAIEQEDDEKVLDDLIRVENLFLDADEVILIDKE